MLYTVHVRQDSGIIMILADTLYLEDAVKVLAGRVGYIRDRNGRILYQIND